MTLSGAASLVITAPPAQAKPDGLALANEFANAYIEWGRLYEHRDPGALDLHEVRAWKTLKEHFSTLRKFIDLEYSE